MPSGLGAALASNPFTSQSHPKGEENALWKLARRSTSGWNTRAGLTKGKTSFCSSFSNYVVALSDNFLGSVSPLSPRLLVTARATWLLPVALPQLFVQLRSQTSLPERAGGAPYL